MDEAKNHAVEDAYRRARSSADTLARASGRTLGELSYASVDTFENRGIMPHMARSMSAMASAGVGGADGRIHAADGDGDGACERAIQSEVGINPPKKIKIPGAPFLARSLREKWGGDRAKSNGRSPAHPAESRISKRHCRRRSHCRRCSERIDLQRQPIDLPHHHQLPDGKRRRRDRVPEFAVNEDLALRRKRGLRHSGFADQALRSGDHFVAARFDGDGHQEGGDQAEAGC